MNNQSHIPTTNHFSSQPNLACEGNIAWSAILIGALASIGLSFLLNLFSMAIGLTVISKNAAGNGTLAIGGLIGLLIGAIACMFFSGWLAGYIARPYYRNPHQGGIYGFSAWCLALLVTILTASYVGKFVADSSHFLSNPSVVIEGSDINPPHVLSLSTPSVEENHTITGSAHADPVNAAGMGAFVIFIMFFIGALSSTIGGYYAGARTYKD
ncbi:MAG: Uncharacterized protein K0R24_873 [Gammaproteobacteria bacterium]|jgi:hypothetical protein|nr:Uncharacterized protein [Gammaproteobacteria bacterium]